MVIDMDKDGKKMSQEFGKWYSFHNTANVIFNKLTIHQPFCLEQQQRKQWLVEVLFYSKDSQNTKCFPN